MARPFIKGCPCAACLDEATAELDLARCTKRTSLRDSNSPRRLPLIESRCSARHMGNKGNSLFRQLKKIRTSQLKPRNSFAIPS